MIGAGEPAPSHLARRVRAAHGDLAEREGRLRASSGGGALALPGIRLMASGLPRPQWNNADVVEPAAAPRIDIDAVRRWYAERGVPWGMRVPLGSAWPYGRRVLTKRAMAVSLDEAPTVTDPAPGPDDVLIVVAGPGDLDAFARVDAAAFDDAAGPTADYARPRRRGIGTTLTIHLLRWSRGEGADLAWLNPDDDRAARLSAALGFREVAGFDVYVDG